MSASYRCHSVHYEPGLHIVNDAMDDLDAGRLQGRGILVPSDGA
jgi:hypothetical protein